MSLSKVVNPGPHLIISEKAMNLMLHGISGTSISLYFLLIISKEVSLDALLH